MFDNPHINALFYICDLIRKKNRLFLTLTLRKKLSPSPRNQGHVKVVMTLGNNIGQDKIHDGITIFFSFDCPERSNYQT